MGGPSSWEWMIYFGLPALLQPTIISIGNPSCSLQALNE